MCLVPEGAAGDGAAMTSDEERLGHVVFQTRLQQIEELEAEVRKLTETIARLKDAFGLAYALVAQASHMVDDSYPNWHHNAERFLNDHREEVQ